MELSRPIHGLVVVGCWLLCGCHTRVDGEYQLDLEQTKECVAKTAATDPEEGKGKEQAIKVLEATRVSLRLEPDGKLLSTTVLSMDGPPLTSKTSGTWKLDGKRVIFKVQGDADTFCDIDASRLRCQKQTDLKLYGHYVLVRK
jgi:hypothetical protein